MYIYIYIYIYIYTHTQMYIHIYIYVYICVIPIICNSYKSFYLVVWRNGSLWVTLELDLHKTI